jgi:hypothetical protein
VTFSLRTYAAYSIGCLAAWAVVLAVVESVAKNGERHAVLLVFLGWAIGWTSATIARAVYPPHKSRQSKEPVVSAATDFETLDQGSAVTGPSS